MRFNSKLGTGAAHRWGMMRSMVDALLVHERIKTTLARAKELRRVADRVVRWGKDGSETARQHARSIVRTEAALDKLFDEIGPRFQDRQGGYTRVLRTAPRAGDNAAMAFVEYVGWREKHMAAADPADIVDGVPSRDFLKARRTPA